jgi:hypothetical protein
MAVTLVSVLELLAAEELDAAQFEAVPVGDPAAHYFRRRKTHAFTVIPGLKYSHDCSHRARQTPPAREK